MAYKGSPFSMQAQVIRENVLDDEEVQAVREAVQLLKLVKEASLEVQRQNVASGPSVLYYMNFLYQDLKAASELGTATATTKQLSTALINQIKKRWVRGSADWIFVMSFFDVKMEEYAPGWLAKRDKQRFEIERDVMTTIDSWVEPITRIKGCAD